LLNNISFIPASIGVIKDDESSDVLFIKRQKPPFQNMWSLPGGKIEADEHVEGGVIREVLEECGISCEINGFLGVVSEIVFENGLIARNHLLHIFELRLIKGNLYKTCSWINPFDIENSNNIPPSDIMIVKKMLFEKESNYYNCVLSYDREKYSLIKFERL
jgi:ADP-ribose pyrophosphatase YjhB (NUDIX family)